MRAFSPIPLSGQFRALAPLLLVGVAVRLAFAPFTRHPLDVESWRILGSLIFEGKNDELFMTPRSYYPPLWLLLQLPIYRLYLGARQVLPINQELVFNLVVKAPLIVSDIGVALGIYWLGLRLGNPWKAKLAATLWFLNPVPLIMSGVWGMFDSLPALFSLLALALFSKAKLRLSAFALAVGVAFKGYPILFAPFYLIALFKSKNKKATSSWCFALAVSLAALFSTYVFLGGTPPISSVLVYRATPQPSVFINPDSMSYQLYLQRIIPQLRNAPLFFFLVIGLFLAILVAARRERANNVTGLSRHFAAACFGFYLAYPVINEQYFLWALPFLIIEAVYGSRLNRRFLYVTSLIVFVFILAHYEYGAGFLSEVLGFAEQLLLVAAGFTTIGFGFLFSLLAIVGLVLLIGPALRLPMTAPSSSGADWNLANGAFFVVGPAILIGNLVADQIALALIVMAIAAAGLYYIFKQGPKASLAGSNEGSRSSRFRRLTVSFLLIDCAVIAYLLPRSLGDEFVATQLRITFWEASFLLRGSSGMYSLYGYDFTPLTLTLIAAVLALTANFTWTNLRATLPLSAVVSAMQIDYFISQRIWSVPSTDIYIDAIIIGAVLAPVFVMSMLPLMTGLQPATRSTR